MGNPDLIMTIEDDDESIPVELDSDEEAELARQQADAKKKKAAVKPKAKAEKGEEFAKDFVFRFDDAGFDAESGWDLKGAAGLLDERTVCVCDQ